VLPHVFSTRYFSQGSQLGHDIAPQRQHDQKMEFKFGYMTAIRYPEMLNGKGKEVNTKSESFRACLTRSAVRGRRKA
jgi:hypothetical protein